MTDTVPLLVLLALLAVPLSWLVPRGWAMDVVAGWTALVLAVLSPVTALWLVGASVLTPLWLRLAERIGAGHAARNGMAGLWVLVLLAPFVTMRIDTDLPTIGGAFFTLRLLHVTGDWWMGRAAAPGLREHLRYQLFLPVIVSGPINRIENFTRQCARRRLDAQDVLSGLERALIGAGMAFPVVYLLAKATTRAGEMAGRLPAFWREWILSALDWVQLYFTFAGMTAIALGLALAMGLRLEENFNRPWAARSLLDFWMRWHMTLSGWVIDYVFRPVSAATRNALAGLVAAMAVIGLWHEFSAYYLLWALWQVLGIVLTRWAAGHVPAPAVLRPAGVVAGPLFVLAWLSAARPVIHLLQELAA